MTALHWAKYKLRVQTTYHSIQSFSNETNNNSSGCFSVLGKGVP